MISRRTTLILSEVYAKSFYSSYTTSGGRGTTRRYRVNVDELYDFLFSNNYPAWFCNLTKKTADYADTSANATRKLKEFIMRLHTGETISEATPQ